MRVELPARISAVAAVAVAAGGVAAVQSAEPASAYTMTAAEFSFCINPFNTWDCHLASNSAVDAENLAQSQYHEYAADGYKGNAFQHATWNSYMYGDFGWNWPKAQGFSDRHEVVADVPARMDYHNNRKGLGVGTHVRWDLGLTGGAYGGEVDAENTYKANNAVLMPTTTASYPSDEWFGGSDSRFWKLH